MKPNFFYLLLICSFFSCKESNQSTETHKKNFSLKEEPARNPEIQLTNLKDTKKLLNLLYRSTNFDTLKNVLWVPNQSEHPQIPVCFDHYAHTGIDTILFFRNFQGIESAAVILANFNLSLDNNQLTPTGGHFSGLSLGVALFENYNGQWNLYAFKKHLTDLGYYGIYRTGRSDQGQIALKKIGPTWTCLSFKQGIGGNTGEFWGTETWFSIERESPKFEQKAEQNEINVWNYTPLNQLFVYNYTHNYYFPDLENQNEIEIAISTIKTKSPVYDLELNIHKSNYNLETNKTNSASSEKKIFRYSPELNLFIEKE